MNIVQTMIFLGYITLALTCLIPAAVWFGIQIGLERANQKEN